jgi:hypothetical protein
MIDAQVTLETTKLDGLALTWAAGVAAGHDLVIVPPIAAGQPPKIGFGHFREHEFAPLTDAGQMWALVDGHICHMDDCMEPACGWSQYPDGKQYAATVDRNTVGVGSSKGIAVLRALVQWKFGYHVDVPAALLVSQ